MIPRPSFAKASSPFLICLLLLCTIKVNASHIVGGNMSYRYLGNNDYEVTLKITQDCYTGNGIAIQEDNPAFIGIYGGDGLLVSIESINSTDAVQVVPHQPDCKANIQNCFRNATFKKTFHLPPNNSGYNIVWQRCCRPIANNLQNADGCGMTLFCSIKPTYSNTSAVFNNTNPVVACVSNEMLIDNSATDADGDSLSYEFSELYCGGTVNDAKPTPLPPPFSVAVFPNGLPYNDPLGVSAALTLSAASGMLTATPDIIGRFYVGIACHEWREGIKINTVRKEFQVMVTTCPGSLPAYQLDTAVVAGTTINFNAPAGGTSYTWTPGLHLSDSTVANPTAYYSAPGNYTYLVFVSDTSGCTRVDTVHVDVLSGPDGFVASAFTPNDDGANDMLRPVMQPGMTLRTFRIYNRYGNLMSDNVNGWDGSYKGRQQSTGTFFWRCSYQDKTGRLKSMSGSSVLVR